MVWQRVKRVCEPLLKFPSVSQLLKRKWIRCVGSWNSCANIIISICHSTGNLLCKHHSCFTFTSVKARKALAADPLKRGENCNLNSIVKNMYLKYSVQKICLKHFIKHVCFFNNNFSVLKLEILKAVAKNLVSNGLYYFTFTPN